MAKRKNNVLKRAPATRDYRSVCWVSTEGQTERDYFTMQVFKDSDLVVKYPQKVHPGRTNPAQVLKRFQKEMRSGSFRKNDEVWLVVDVDEWNEAELSSLIAWERQDKRHHLAISNPKFELYLVMHYGKAGGCTTPQAIDAALGRYMPRYDKRLKPTAFDRRQVETAILHAKAKRRSCTTPLPERGMTDAYRLAERLLEGKGV